MSELARVAIVLSLFVFLLGAPAAIAASPSTLVQQASALVAGKSLCGHGRAPIACHAPRRLLPAGPGAAPAARAGSRAAG